MKIFLTGGTGLLGEPLAEEMARFAEVTSAGHVAPGRKREPAVKIDLTDREAIDRALDGKGYTHFVHSAAWRVPEDCFRDPAGGYMLNAVAVEYIAAACRRNSIKLAYMSTEGVFSGTKPPYREEDIAEPVNVYGRTKLAGEFAAKSVEPHLIVRIPALWGNDPEDSRSSLKSFLAKFEAGKPFPVENTLIRHFTLAADVAKGVAFCIEKELTGIVHIQASEQQTKADFARLIAKHYGYDPNLVVNAGQPAVEDCRPYDTTLDTGRYDALGGPRIRDLTEVFADMRAQS